MNLVGRSCTEQLLAALAQRQATSLGTSPDWHHLKCRRGLVVAVGRKSVAFPSFGCSVTVSLVGHHSSSVHFEVHNHT